MYYINISFYPQQYDMVGTPLHNSVLHLPCSAYVGTLLTLGVRAKGKMNVEYCKDFYKLLEADLLL